MVGETKGGNLADNGQGIRFVINGQYYGRLSARGVALISTKKKVGSNDDNQKAKEKPLNEVLYIGFRGHNEAAL